ncbi:T9SS type A sorting domain-containing protein [Lewinella cohaerens]|uniref:T9SS type A sorting domain-containing protein n=1 Tax=Lewinella cohaerens TaxID=70995 RepID=UPI00146F64B1|nr:T9SS type A sorting domain-containing protein [Lewinella cohaerens]
MKKFYLLFLLCSLSMMTAKAQVTDILTGLTFPYDCALYGDDLYIAELGAGRIIKIDITAPAPPPIEVVLTGLLNPAAMTISGDFLYYGESGADRVSKIDLTQATPVPEVVLNTGLATPNDLFVDGDLLYITDEGVDQLIRVDLTEATPTPTIIASGLNNPLGIAKFGDAIYLSIFGSSSIVKVDITQTPAVVTTVATGFSQPAGITLDGSFLYIAESGQVSRINLNADTPTAEAVVTEGIVGSRNVAFDGIDMYIAQTGGTFGATGKVSKLTIGTPAFSNLPNVCSDDMPTMLGGASPSSGVYSGPGVTDNGDGSTFSFNPAAAGGVGTFNVTYTLGGVMASTTLEVVAAPTVTFSTGGLSVQVDAGVQTGLSGGMPAGGVYSGNGVTDNGNGMTYSFDPAAAGEGENVITYTYSDANGCGGEQGAVITVTALAVPGDLCDEAIDISAQFGQAFNEPQTTGLYDNTDFATGADDPVAGFDCFYGGDQLQNSGWFSFTGDGNTYQVRNVQCTGPNTDLDLQAVVYSGSCGNLTTVACNDDNPAGGTLTFLLEFDTEEGVEYLILVDGFDGTVGEFCIEVTNLTDPLLPGEMCTNPIDISALVGQAEMVPQVSDTYDNAEYNTDDTDLVPSCFFQLQDGTATIYYAFTGDGNRYTINSINNSNLDAPLAGVLYTGTCGMLTEVACAYQGGVANFGIDIETEAGVDYLLMVTEDFFELSNTFNLEFTNQGTTGVTDITTTALRVFPNPTNGLVQLPQIDMERVEAYDATGRLVVSQQQPGTSIDLGAQPAGLYILKMYAGQEVYSAKVVKE